VRAPNRVFPTDHETSTGYSGMPHVMTGHPTVLIILISYIARPPPHVKLQYICMHIRLVDIIFETNDIHMKRSPYGTPGSHCSQPELT
jgi:hypothetical protein